MNKKSLLAFLLIAIGYSAFAGTASKDSIASVSAKEKYKWLDGFRFSGYIQAQYQLGGKDVDRLFVGGENQEHGEEMISRLGIRRGRLKLGYEKSLFSAVFQVDITEKGISVKDVYLKMKDPWHGTNSLTVGVLNRPFGYEITYSSSLRESPERALVFRKLFPGERDLGAVLTLQLPEHSALSFLKLDAGIFSGNGINQDIDNKKDFIGHLLAEKTFAKIGFGAGFSYYNGRVKNYSDMQGASGEAVRVQYEMSGSSFRPDTLITNTGVFMKREYLGVELQFRLQSVVGKTQIRGEYLWGTQPGTMYSSESPNYKDRTAAGKASAEGLFSRPFNGYYIYLIQGIGKSPVSLVFKYDSYDPNTAVSGKDIGKADTYTSATDIRMDTYGFGATWAINKNFLLMAYMDMVRNEKTPHIESYAKERQDNVFTLRMQYKF